MDRDNLIALREAVSSLTGLVQTIKEPSWAEKQAMILTNNMIMADHQSKISKDNMDYQAMLAAEQAGFIAETAQIDFGDGSGRLLFGGYGFGDFFNDKQRKETFQAAMSNFEINHGFFMDNQVNVMQSWAYFGKKGEGVQEAIDQATTAIATLKTYRTADEDISGVPLDTLDNYIAYYEDKIEKLNSDPAKVRSHSRPSY